MPTDINSITAWAAIITAITTTVSFVLIFSTLKIQIRSNMIEEERRLMDKKPVFTAAHDLNYEHVNSFIDRQSVIYGRFYLNLHRSDIYNFKVNSFIRTNIKQEDFLVHAEYNESIGFIQGSEISFYTEIDKIEFDFTTQGDMERKLYEIKLLVCFSDAAGNRYCQKINVPYENRPIAFPPLPVKKNKIN